MPRFMMMVCTLALYSPGLVQAVCSHDPSCLHLFLDEPPFDVHPGYSQEHDERYGYQRDYYDFYYGYPVMVPGGRYRNDYAPTPDGDPYGPYRDKGPPAYYGYPYYVPERY